MKTTLLLLAALSAATIASAQKLVIKGSDTLGAKLVPQLAEEYKAKHPGVSFEIAAEGSTTGIAAITDGTAQIGMSSRRAKPTEMSAATAKGVTLKPIVVAYDGMAGNEQIAAEVAKNPNGIGYVGLAYIHVEGIKVVPADGVLPTRISRTLTIPLRLCALGRPKEPLRV
ncbi:MAG: substrate-binding domain-containing protein [Verrucomicrobia bacterium]|nr:substrate-binding domain-containing protein [Verrucomicrobiota bacterium]